MSYTEYVDGYALEGATFKNSTVLNDPTDTAYLLGAINENSEMPSAVLTANFPPTAVDSKEVASGSSWTSNPVYRGMLGIVLQNGIPIWLGMGKSSTVDAAPLYTHTITPTDDGTLLPSIVLQHEEKGSATNEEYQWRGVKVDSLMLHHDMSAQGANVLLAKLEIAAAEEADPAFALTTPPALPPTSNSAPYVSLTRTWDYGSGNTALTGLQKVEISIANGLQAHKGADDTIYCFSEWARKQYIINMIMTLNTVERDMWDKKVAKTNTNEMYFKWTRSTNDYIECTATNCNITVHPVITPKTGPALLQVVLEPEALSFTVKDSIAGGLYGE